LVPWNGTKLRETRRHTPNPEPHKTSQSRTPKNHRTR
jgi:hypothetical protein